MDKQELKEKVKSLESFNPCTGTDFEWGFDVCRHEVLSLIQALDEPQRVKVPAVVAEWFEINKEQLEVAIWDLTTETYETDRDQLSEIQLWIKESDIPYKTLISMQDGYEVEEEPKWVVLGERGYLTSLSIGKGKSTGWTGNNDKHESGAIHFEDEETALHTAYITGGTVEKV